MRKSNDFYPTPKSAILSIKNKLNLPIGNWLEPAYGDGAIVSCFPNMNWTTIDINGKAQITSSYLDWKPDKHYDVIITNPPFSLAQEFVEKALIEGTHVVMLLKLSFLESQKREALHFLNPPSVFALTHRLKDENGKSDNAAYGWFYWGPMFYRHLEVI